MLFNHLFARKHGGTLVLRIEDTDQERSTKESEVMVISDLKRLGFKPDESPEVGGPYPPYRQSERLKMYGKYAKELLDRDHRRVELVEELDDPLLDRCRVICHWQNIPPGEWHGPRSGFGTVSRPG